MASGNDQRLSYQTGVQVTPAANMGVLGGLLSPSQGGDQRANDFAKMTSMNDQAQTGFAAQQVNAQQMANAQAKRSEAAVSGLNNQMQVASDMNARTNQQVDLAAQVASANAGYSAGVTAAGIKQWKNFLRGNA